jgi:uncharacterized protein (TIGR02270 family)
MVAAPIVALVVRQHLEECVSLYNARRFLTAAGHSRLEGLRRFDGRLVAHLDGVAVAGAEAWPLCDELLEAPSAGAVFTAAVRALEERDNGRLARLFDLVSAIPDARDGLDGAFLWVPTESLKGVVAGLMTAEDGNRRLAAVAACGMRGVDPDLAAKGLLQDPDPRVRARALRAAGEIGRQDLVGAFPAAMANADLDCQFWGKWSAVVLGDRNHALSALVQTATEAGPYQARAFGLALQAMNRGSAHGLLRDLAGKAEQVRWVIQGSALAGDAASIPWLIDHMRDDTLTRLAGESFGVITGVDLSHHTFERPQPEGIESGPNDNPDDENVEMDPDEGLPWPDADKVAKWWAANAHRFQPGTRYFMGAPVTREHCIDVLKNGYQRQRILAAHYLCLLEPGTPLFNTSAPAWRQQRLLARM